MTTLDVLALLGPAALAVLWGLHARRTLRVLNDTEHFEHETAKEAVKMSHERAERDRLRFP